MRSRVLPEGMRCWATRRTTCSLERGSVRFVAAIVWERRRALCTVASGVGTQPRQRFTHADHGIVLDDAVVREPVAVEQVRRCRSQVLVRFETQARERHSVAQLPHHVTAHRRSPWVITDARRWVGAAVWGRIEARAPQQGRSEARGRPPPRSSPPEHVAG